MRRDKKIVFRDALVFLGLWAVTRCSSAVRAAKGFGTAVPGGTKPFAPRSPWAVATKPNGNNKLKSIMYIVQMNGATQQQFNQGTTAGKQKTKYHHYFNLKPLFLFFCVFVSLGATAQYSKKDLRLLRKGKAGTDTSFVYQLPFEPGTAHFVVQGYYGWFSHRNRLALDFKMKRATKVCAARGGVVVRVRETGKKGGWHRKYRSEGNMVIIQHSDGSRAGYWHLQFEGALVNVGDTVQQGQVIGLSGKTGYTTAPHLHFLVWTNKNGGWQQVPTRFKTQKGTVYLRPFRKYRSMAVSD